jgi:pantoate--beta-alanine ligase
VRGVQEGLCGASRPGHFVGVATVVTKLFRIVRPHVALFGEKDYQQLRVLARLAVDLHLDVEVVGLPLVREPDGLAMSSRNVRLSVEERQQALVLSRALTSAARAFSEGERRVGRLLDEARAELAREPAVELQYLELRDAESLAVLDGELLGPALLAVAAWLGPRDTPERRTRLIDNVLLGR